MLITGILTCASDNPQADMSSSLGAWLFKRMSISIHMYKWSLSHNHLYIYFTPGWRWRWVQLETTPQGLRICACYVFSISPSETFVDCRAPTATSCTWGTPRGQHLLVHTGSSLEGRTLWCPTLLCTGPLIRFDPQGVDESSCAFASNRGPFHWRHLAVPKVQTCALWYGKFSSTLLSSLSLCLCIWKSLSLSLCVCHFLYGSAYVCVHIYIPSSK